MTVAADEWRVFELYRYVRVVADYRCEWAGIAVMRADKMQHESGIMRP